MAQTWKYAIGLGMLGATLAAGCTVTSGDDDSTSGAAGEAGTGGSGGSTGGSGGKGGSSGKGGAAGKGGSAGTAGTAGKGGSAGTAGTGGSTGGTAGVGGSSGASGDGSGGTSGTNSDPVATCDPEQGTLASEPFDSCEPSEDATGDALECQECMESACCEETKICYGTDLYNVCGWGGPTDGEYAGKNEIGCFIKCLTDYVVENEFCDSDGASDCAVECATPKCSEGAGQFPLVGNATSDLAGCLQLNCSDECFGADTCED